MTAIGKIFAIINLLFSLVVASFIVLVYIRGTNWAIAQKKWEDAYRAADASRVVAEKDLNDARVTNATALQEKDAKIKELEGRVTAAEGVASRRLKELEAYQTAGTPKDAELAAVKTELAKRATEIKGLDDQIKDLNDKVTTTLAAKNEEIRQRIASEINATSYKNKAEGLEKRVRETEMKLAKVEARGGGSATSVAVSSGGNPAPRVEGVVTDLRGDLLQISLGSDSGLEKDHLLDVYRLRPTPQYIGQIRLKDVRAKDAVGVFVDKPKGQVLKGDLVSNDVYSRN